MYRLLTVTFLSFICAGDTCAQYVVPIQFRNTWNYQPIELEKSIYHNQDTDSVSITNLKYYISGLALLHNGHEVYAEPNSVHLIDARIPKSTTIFLSLPKDVLYDKVSFNLGIDSVTNVSGAMGGDLDPTKGMYWTWQSGYINYKLEGKSNVCKTRNNEFHFHLGGYGYPFGSIQKIVLNLERTDSITIKADIATFVKQIDLVNQNNVMIPGDDALKLSRLAASIFSIQK